MGTGPNYLSSTNFLDGYYLPLTPVGTILRQRYVIEMNTDNEVEIVEK
jgi:hypothetical protein